MRFHSQYPLPILASEAKHKPSIFIIHTNSGHLLPGKVALNTKLSKIILYYMLIIFVNATLNPGNALGWPG